MFKNYITIAVRNAIHNKLYSAINILGLAIGLAACILILLFVRDELSYDQHWQNADRLYRLHVTAAIPGREPFVGSTTPGIAKVSFEKYFSQEIELVTRFRGVDALIKKEDGVYAERVHFTDPETVEMFDLSIIQGNYRQALNDNTSLAISQSFATRHFGGNNAIGELISIEFAGNRKDYKVGAVFKDLPHNTTLEFHVLGMIDEKQFKSQPSVFNSWYMVSVHMFYQLKKEVDHESVSTRLDAFTNDTITNPFPASESKTSDTFKYSGMNIQDLQLNAKGVLEMKTTGRGSKTTTLIFLSIAILILLVACTNFMNLATAKSTQRAREVALRKVLGGSRLQLIMQFLGESMLIAFVGLILSIALVEISLPFFSDFLSKDLIFSYSDPITLVCLFGLILCVGFISGIYPALILSKFRPSQVLKSNKSLASSGSVRLRNSLVIFQFTISIVLIVAATVVYSQMYYAEQKDLGFNKEGLLILNNIGRLSKDQHSKETFKQEFRRAEGVLSLSFLEDSLGEDSERNVVIDIPGRQAQERLMIGKLSIDEDFFSTLDIPLIAGRDFSVEHQRDRAQPNNNGGIESEANVIINNSAVSRLGFGDANKALGQVIRIEGSSNLTVIGVAPDVHFQSLKKTIRPEIYLMTSSQFQYLAVRYRGNPAKLIKQLRGIWTEWVPNIPFDYSFVDQNMDAAFEQEAKIATMLTFFTVLTLIIGCLGLFGLVSFSAERRTKEIGIRKVMGASLLDIIRLLIWQFSKPVLLANIIAWPIAVYTMLLWLETFPYRLDTWVLLPLCLLAGLIALMITWATVVSNASKAARKNPIEALRYE
jgi:putative ABC transport system permease protein